MKHNQQVFESVFKEVLSEAQSGAQKGEGGPFGAAIVRNGEVISLAHNTVLKDNDPTAHAEVNAIRAACKKLGTPHLKNCILIASSEPCPMCLAAAYWAQVSTIYFSLPHIIASEYGFSDSEMYKDMLRKPDTRKVKTIHCPQFENEGKTIFERWKDSQGKVY